MPVCRTAPSSIRRGHVARDRDLHVGDFRLLQRAQRTGRLDDGVDLAHVNEAVAIGARHLVVDLRDHVVGALRGGQSGVDADAEAAEAVRVGR